MLPRRLLLATLLCTLSLSHYCATYGQGLDRSKLNIVHRNVTLDSVNVVAVANDTGRILIGPDPDNIAALINLLTDDDVANDLQLNKETRIAIEEFFVRERKLLAGSDEFSIDVARNLRREVISELLTPQQLERLKQIVYRMEVAVLGLDGALANGRLGERANVYENQRTRILTKGNQCIATRDATVKSLRMEAEEKIIQCLSNEQEVILRPLIGPFFYSSDANLIGYSTKGSDLQNKDQAIQLLMNPEIQHELKLAKEDINSISKLLETQANELRELFPLLSQEGRISTAAAYKEARKELLERILNESDIRRLTQIVYRIEMSARGLVWSILSGSLSHKLVLSETQKLEFMTRGKAIESELTIGIVAAYEEAESNLLEELAPEQREIAKTLLGKMFMFNDYISGMKATVDRIKSRSITK